MSWLQYHLKMVHYGLGNKNKPYTHGSDGGLELGWVVQVRLFDTAFKIGCSRSCDQCATRYHCHPPVVTLALPVGFLPKDLLQGPL